MVDSQGKRSAAHDESRAAADDGAAPNLFATPSLPKGGGALKGIGEALTPNLVTGTCSLSVPVFTTHARDLSPTLSLAYDSGGGNGAFGIGWKLSPPSIVRRTDHGLPRYRDAEESDEFLLGGEVLVRSSLPGDARVDVATGMRVQRYRPRVESAFRRIEQWTDPVSGAMHWVTVDRANVRSLFGATADARIADPADPARRIFEWMCEETRDDRGNVARYVYKREDGVNVPRTPSEDGRGAATQLYLKRIYYGNRTPNKTGDEVVQIVFDYGEHGAADTTTETPDDEAAWPTPDEQPRGWDYRADPFSSYRAGFELRTRRICRRVLVFHQFAELGSGWWLVRSTDLAYDATPVTSYLRRVTQTGWRNAEPAASRPAEKVSWPPVEMTYQQPVLDTLVRTLDAGSLDGLRDGLDASVQQWVDLDGEGIAGVLTKEADAWWYKRNLGGGQLAAPEQLLRQPWGDPDRPPQLMDLAGSGRKDLVSFERGQAGYCERLPQGGWRAFAAFESLPSFDMADRNVRQLDLDGDGLTDVLLNEDEVLLYYPSLGRAGFGPPERVRKSSDERTGPAIVLVEETQTIFLADMTGDGLTDIVRIRDGEVCYWPNLGFGRFGAKVTMVNAPTFGGPEAFDPARLRLGDIDGSGTTDIVYLAPAGAIAWFNQSGNGWSVPALLRDFPAPTKLESVQLLDLLGSGTSCLVWSTNDPADAGSSIRYLDLLGGKKPHLLSSLDNHLGRTVTMEYAPSTQFYVADRLAGQPWITRVPFPVQVLVRAETRDTVAQSRIVTRYRYHHGYFDGIEREFRGFGLVETWDAESFGVSPDDTTSTLDVPPVYTKTWFHTGVFPEDGSVSRHFAKEYWAVDPGAMAPPDTKLPPSLADDDAREALRALKGMVLRREVYAEDDPELAALPFAVTESTYELRVIQPVQGDRHGVFFVHPRETIDLHYERVTADPRVTHHLVLAVDGYGTITQDASVAYPRRGITSGPQGARIATCTVHEVTNVDGPDVVHLGVAIRSDAYELGGLPGPASAQLMVEGLQGTVAMLLAAGNVAAIDADWTTTPPGAPALRELSRERTYYWNDGLTAELPAGQIGTRALVRRTQSKVLSTGQASRAYGSRAPDAVLQGDCAFENPDGDGSWWASSSVVTPEAVFYQALTSTDPFGKTTTLARDAYRLVVTSVTDPVGNVVTVLSDYRTLQPVLLTDANGNQSAARYDAMGMLVAMALMGKGEGHTLAAPTLAFEYHLDASPAFVHIRAAQTWGPTPTYVDAFTYSDGSGHEAERKVRVDAGPAPELDASGHVVRQPDGTPVVVNTAVRWVGTGRTVLDNKGNPVKKYEPFFSATSDYEGETELAQWGVTPLLHYDALGRLVKTDFPDQTFSRVEIHDAWTERHWDQNDTVVDSTWYKAIKQPGSGASPALVRAADQAALDAGTYEERELDPLGRKVSTVVDLGGGHTLVTRLELDAADNMRAIVDPRGIRTTQLFDMKKRAVATVSPDSGSRSLLYDANGAVARMLGARGFSLVSHFDDAHRKTHMYKLDDGAPAGTVGTLVERTIYGEALDVPGQPPAAAAKNLRGRRYQVYDAAGLLMTDSYDLKGNVLQTTRRLAKAYQSTPDWSPLDDLPLAQVNPIAIGLLDSPEGSFVTQTVYDPLDRPTRVVAPDQSATVPGFDVASGLLKTIDVYPQGAASATRYVTDVTYNARGQRLTCAYGHGATTTYVYEPTTFRLSQVTTTRASGGSVQDLTYTYDPVGNVMEIDQADAVDAAFFGAGAVSASPMRQYTYDAAYRLTSTLGRELPPSTMTPPDSNDVGWATGIPDASDAAKLRAYLEGYQYDDSGNLVHVDHQLQGVVGPNTKWTRDVFPETTSNHLAPNDPSTGSATGYTTDAHGNLLTMPGSHTLDWDYADRLQHAGGAGDAYYTYDAAGQRVRKVILHTDATVEERIYVGGWETYRKSTGTGPGGTPAFERETLRVMDDKSLVALVETTTTAPPGQTEAARSRYQIADHLGTTCVELDEHANVISYEEFYAYGGTAYAAANGIVEVSAKRYRYDGKERDEETGLYYYGARYYAPWLGRWLSADPAGLRQGPNAFLYAQDKPTCLVDPNGCAPEIPQGHLDLLDTVQQIYSHFMTKTPGTPTQQGTNGGAAAEAFFTRAGGKAVETQVDYAAEGAQHSIDVRFPSVKTSVELKKTPAASRSRQDMSHNARAAELAKDNANTEIKAKVFSDESGFEAANFGKAPTAAEDREAAQIAAQLRSQFKKETGVTLKSALRATGKVLGGGLNAINVAGTWTQAVDIARTMEGIEIKEDLGLLKDDKGDFAIFTKQNPGWFSDDSYFKAYFSDCSGEGLNRVCTGDPRELVPISSDEAHKLDDKLQGLYGTPSKWWPTGFNAGSLRKNGFDPAPHFIPKGQYL